MLPHIRLDQLQKAKNFIYINGRLLERKLFEYFFEDGTKQSCLKALSAYQNADGGFGNGIEPDLSCPDSTAIGAETAMYVLDLLDGCNTETANRLVDWIITHQDTEGFIPHPPENFFHYPYQPWWKNPDKERILSLAGMMRKWGLDQPGFFEKTRNCYRSLPFPVDLEFYNYPYFIYLKYCSVSDEERAQFSGIIEQIPPLLSKYSNHFPLFSRGWYLAYEYVVKDILDREIANFINALKDDGGIVTPYPDFPWWDPIFLLDGLIQLKYWHD
jgi:hypothetical protein